MRKIDFVMLTMVATTPTTIFLKRDEIESIHKSGTVTVVRSKNINWNVIETPEQVIEIINNTRFKAQELPR